MVETADIGQPGGQQFDVQKAIRTFLRSMKEHGASVASMVMRELLQNADDAGANAVAVILDERPAPSQLPGRLPVAYAALYQPALLVANDGPFTDDDFRAVCEVATSYKQERPTAAGRFGIGFNSVYFLTDVAVVFSRRQVEVFDLTHRIFRGNGWRFLFEDFRRGGPSAPRPEKAAFEVLLPKAALGAACECDRTFGQLVQDDAEFGGALFRLPLRQVAEGAVAMADETFPGSGARLALLRQMAAITPQSIVFLKSVHKVRFGVLRERHVQWWVDVDADPPTPDFRQFVGDVERLAREEQPHRGLGCHFDRSVTWTRRHEAAVGDEDSEGARRTWSFHVKHAALFDDRELLEMRRRLWRNHERATPWAAIAVPLDASSARLDGEQLARWRVVLPLGEAGPSACLLSGELFIGPSRQQLEFKTDGSDEAMRKTEWNRLLVERAVLPMLRDASLDLADRLGPLAAEHPEVYLDLFPGERRTKGEVRSLAEHVRDCFSRQPWVLRLYDVWGREVDLWIAREGETVRLEAVPEWLTRYKNRFQTLSTGGRYFVSWNVARAIKARVAGSASVAVAMEVQCDVARAVLSHTNPPREQDLEPLTKVVLEAASGDATALNGLWGFSGIADRAGVRFGPEYLYVIGEPDEPPIHRAIRELNLGFERTEWVAPQVGLAAVSLRDRWRLANVVGADNWSALELLRRLERGSEHDSVRQVRQVIPIVDFLCGTRRGSELRGLRLGFLVRTTWRIGEVPRVGSVVLRPEPASPEDDALWQVWFRRLFPNVDPEFARELRRLLASRPECLEMVSSADFRLSVCDVRHTLEILHRALGLSADLAGRLFQAINDPQHVAEGKSERAAVAFLEEVDRTWDSLDPDLRATVCLLPVHRTGEGRFVALAEDRDGTLETARERFALQSERDDDLTGAPVRLPDRRLLWPPSPSVRKFYRRRLGLREHDRVRVLLHAIGQMREGGETGHRLLAYTAEHLPATLRRLEADAREESQQDARELKAACAATLALPCVDGGWWPARESRVGWDVAARLRAQGWPDAEVPALIGRLFEGQRVVMLDREVERALRALGDVCQVRSLDPDELPERALRSSADGLTVGDRLRLLHHNPVNVTEALDRLPIGALPVAALAGSVSLADAELVDAGLGLREAVLRQISPRALDPIAVGRACGLPREEIVKILTMLRVSRLTVAESRTRVERAFVGLWEGLSDSAAERLALLEWIGREDLAERLASIAQRLPVVLTARRTPTWVAPGGVISPAWEATQPPALSDDERPRLQGIAEGCRRVWERWCGRQSFAAVLDAVAARVRGTVPADSRAVTALYRWVDEVRDVQLVPEQETREALESVPWVWSRRGDELTFLRPGEVVRHRSDTILGERFWVPYPTARLPRVAEELRLGFLQEPERSRESVRALAGCLEKSASKDRDEALSLYKLLVEWTRDDDDLADEWNALAGEQAVYRLFRDPEAVMPGIRVFVGEDDDEDVGDLLFCLRASNRLPGEVARLYRRLGVAASPTVAQVIRGLSTLPATVAGPALRGIYRRLIQILIKTSDSEVKLPPTLRVLSCAGTLEPLPSCFWDAELGTPQHVEKGGARLLIDSSDASTRRYIEWLRERAAGVVRDLTSMGRLTLEVVPARDVRAEAAEVLGPWRVWFTELAQEGSRVREGVATWGLRIPPRPIEIGIVERMRLSYSLAGDDVVRSREEWEGLEFAQADARILVRNDQIGRSYLDDPMALDRLDNAIAVQVAALLTGFPAGAVESRWVDGILEYLERPSRVLRQLRETLQDHLWRQYWDQTADPEFSALFERYQRTSPRAEGDRQGLVRRMLEIVEQRFALRRRDIIRGHGYDATSVFAELVQNAEDAYAERDWLGMDPPARRWVLFRYQADQECSRLIVRHYGRPFNYSRHGSRESVLFARDVEGVLRSAGSFKPDALGDRPGCRLVGRFGLGFKSVYLLTDAPVIHSGGWHFQIAAGCLPWEVAAPADLEPGETRFVLPLREDLDKNPHFDSRRLGSLLPFLRQVEGLELGDGAGRDHHITSEVEDLGDVRGGRVHADVVTVRGIEGVRGEAATLLRLRDRDGEAQLALRFDRGKPAPWDWTVGFGATVPTDSGVPDGPDLYAVLPLRTRLGCGVAASHLFEIQSGRTHLLPEENGRQFEEVASLVAAVPEALRACVRGTPLNDVLARFWGLWRWDRGDTECAPLRRELARSLVQVAREAMTVPTYDPDTVSSLASGPLYYFGSRVPESVRLAFLNAGIALAEPGRLARTLSPQTVVRDAFVYAYSEACAAAAVDVDESHLLHVGWRELGQACVRDSWLASRPELLNAIADTYAPDRLETLNDLPDDLSWLRDCEVSALDGAGHAVRALPRHLMQREFPGCEHLPARHLVTLAPAYSLRVVRLLRLAGLKTQPTSEEVRVWISRDDATPRECSGILEYLISGARWRTTYFALGELFRSPWFPGPHGRMTTREAVDGGLLSTELVQEPALQAWLGIPGRPFPPPPEPLRPVDPRKALLELSRWWIEDGGGREWIREYERRVYGDATPPRVREFFPDEREDRIRWLRLFLLGSLHTLGRTTIEQHRSFLQLCERRGWLDVFADPRYDPGRWMRVLEEYVDHPLDSEEWQLWVRQFVHIFRLARYLPEYVEAFLAADRARKPLPLDALTRPRRSALFQGGGPEAPSVSRVLGIGACFVMRELRRTGVLTQPVLDEHCFVPKKEVREFVQELGCGTLAIGDVSVEQSRAIFGFLVAHLGRHNATFGNSFDLPLLAAAERPDVRERILNAGRGGR
jgi:hypothetical protein